MIIKTVNPTTHPNPFLIPNLPASPGIPFCTSVVEEALTELQLAVPHAHSLGQQSPPKLAAQLVHPVAQLPVTVALVAAGPTGTTTVMLPDATIVVELVAGQSVVSQSLPVRQQSP